MRAELMRAGSHGTVSECQAKEFGLFKKKKKWESGLLFSCHQKYIYFFTLGIILY